MTGPPYTGPKMETRDAGRRFVRVQREIEPCEVEDLFRYGSRWTEVETQDGVKWRQFPLTRENLFDPQEGDQVSHGNLIVLATENPEFKLELIKGRLVVGNSLRGSRYMLWDFLSGYPPEAALWMAEEQLWWEALREAFQAWDPPPIPDTTRARQEA